MLMGLLQWLLRLTRDLELEHKTEEGIKSIGALKVSYNGICGSVLIVTLFWYIYYYVGTALIAIIY